MGMNQDISFTFMSLNDLRKSQHSGVRIRVTLLLKLLFYWLEQGKVYFPTFNNLTCVLVEVSSDFLVYQNYSFLIKHIFVRTDQHAYIYFILKTLKLLTNIFNCINLHIKK